MARGVDEKARLVRKVREALRVAAEGARLYNEGEEVYLVEYYDRALKKLCRLPEFRHTEECVEILAVELEEEY